MVSPKSASKLMISIHALREEGDKELVTQMNILYEFLSTPSARRATVGWFCFTPDELDFYPRPPRGGRLMAKGWQFSIEAISIHALREEGDLTY